MALTLADLARLAGVSSATVSIALNNKAGVSDETRERIVRLANEVGYRPNRVGRALRQSRSGAVGLYLPNSATDFGYYTQATLGVAEYLYDNDLSLMMMPSSHGTDVIESFPALDGVILIEPHADDRGVKGILRSGLPVVSGDRPPPDVGQPWGIVESPNRESTRRVLDRFRAHGAQRPGLVLIERVSTWAMELEEAYNGWCTEHQLEPRVVLTNIHHSHDEILTTLRPWFDPHVGCDAVLVGGDGIAVRVAGILRTLGHKVGDSVLLVSGVDSPMMEFHTPRITAVDLQPRRFGSACAELLVTLMDSGRPSQPVRRLVDSPLIERDSG